MDNFEKSMQSIEDEQLQCGCWRLQIHTAPLIFSLAGIVACTIFSVFFTLQHEYILLFPLTALFVDHFLILCGNRLRSPKLYILFIYSIKFLITMLVTGMLFYIYIVVGDAKRQLDDDIWRAFRQEHQRVLVAVAFLLFALMQRWFLKVIRVDYELMKHERFMQRTTAIYSLMTEVHSRDEKECPYSQTTTVLIRPFLEEI